MKINLNVVNQKVIDNNIIYDFFLKRFTFQQQCFFQIKVRIKRTEICLNYKINC